MAMGEQSGKTEEARCFRSKSPLILRLLARRVGTLPATAEAQVRALALPELEALGEALLDFSKLAECEFIAKKI
jgi:Domain of unknown function (DUF4351)